MRLANGEVVVTQIEHGVLLGLVQIFEFERFIERHIGKTFRLRGPMRRPGYWPETLGASGFQHPGA